MRTTAKTAREMQRERVERAVGEGEKYVFVADSSGAYHHCVNPATSKAYRVSERGCSCPDWARRAGPRGIMCKHMTALVLAQPEPLVPAPVPAPVPVRKQDRFFEIFG